MGLKSALCGILAFIAWVLQQFGIDFGVDEQTATADAILNVVQGIGILAATIGGLWNKLKARNKSGLLLPILGLSLILAGCALKGLEPYEKAMVITDEMTDAYVTMHETYLQIYEVFPERRQELQDKAAPKLDAAKHAVISLREIATAWATVKTQPDEWDAALDAAVRAVSEASETLKKLEAAS